MLHLSTLRTNLWTHAVAFLAFVRAPRIVLSAVVSTPRPRVVFLQPASVATFIVHLLTLLVMVSTSLVSTCPAEESTLMAGPVLEALWPRDAWTVVVRAAVLVALRLFTTFLTIIPLD